MWVHHGKAGGPATDPGVDESGSSPAQPQTEVGQGAPGPGGDRVRVACPSAQPPWVSWTPHVQGAPHTAMPQRGRAQGDERRRRLVTCHSTHRTIRNPSRTPAPWAAAERSRREWGDRRNAATCGRPRPNSDPTRTEGSGGTRSPRLGPPAARGRRRPHRPPRACAARRLRHTSPGQPGSAACTHSGARSLCCLRSVSSEGPEGSWGPRPRFPSGKVPRPWAETRRPGPPGPRGTWPEHAGGVTPPHPHGPAFGRGWGEKGGMRAASRLQDPRAAGSRGRLGRSAAPEAQHPCRARGPLRGRAPRNPPLADALQGRAPRNARFVFLTSQGHFPAKK